MPRKMIWNRTEFFIFKFCFANVALFAHKFHSMHSGWDTGVSWSGSREGHSPKSFSEISIVRFQIFRNFKASLKKFQTSAVDKDKGFAFHWKIF